ncbi:MAG: helix-turn-helix domain-containing protein [Gammaproteobacteria bacterium]|nr:helix-turn-helix domain-containing protein [Gammaproteobacteria bacterium]
MRDTQRIASAEGLDAASSVVRAPLLGIGTRVREARARRGMTRKLLATHSQVSERYVAQLEAGQANPSVLVLLKLAQALDLPLTELLREAAAEPPELLLLIELLRRQPRAALRELRQDLTQKLGRADDQRRPRIALLGLRGAGKSSLGSRLARSLGCPFIELDQAVERAAGTSLAEIFLLYGQAGYRRHEQRCLENLLELHPRCVIATGGSIVTAAATYDLLLSSCLCVWLKAAPEEHMARVVAQGDTRPMADNAAAMDDLQRILDARTALYAQADRTVETAGLNLEQSYLALAQAIAPTD